MPVKPARPKLFMAPIAALLLGASGLSGCDDDSGQKTVPTLSGRAILPAATFADGPTSGTALTGPAINGQAVPFVDKQPVQGFSAVLDNRDGTFLAMSDNGFSNLENSADYHLRVYTIRPDFKTERGGGGAIEVVGYFELRDPARHIPFAITNHFTQERILTGADFDLESFQRVPDGTFWFGDEFGPFLLHTNAQGVVLEPPVPLPDFDNPGKALRSPQNPFNEEASAVRVMNAVRAHARARGNSRAPVFSPHHAMLKFEDSQAGIKSNPNAHYARGDNPQPGLTKAAGDVFDLKSLQRAGYPVVTWTVNDKPRMLELLRAGVNGIISDRPDLLLEAVREFGAASAGEPGALMDAEGLIDRAKFDAQGHRGGRDLRPENTLPAMEVALDFLMTTLETDTGVTRDGVSILKHDPYIEAVKCRRADGKPYAKNDEVLIKDLTVQEIQTTFICDNLLRGPSQLNDRALSPVAAGFAKSRGLIDPYVMPTVRQLFDFVAAYVDYYKTGPGRAHPDARKRWTNAERVRFNIETKINPRGDRDGENGLVYKERTVDAATMADALAGVIMQNQLAERADVQSFDFRTLLHIQERYPRIRTVYLFGDFPIYASPASDDGTNLQDEQGANTPWLAGLFWPYRVTLATQPQRVRASGGFEGMAMTPDGGKLLPLLERPLADNTDKTLLLHEFDLATKRYTGVRYRYPLGERGVAIGDFILLSDTQGLVIERDDTQGDLNGYKAINRITLRGNGQPVGKEPVVDLLAIQDPKGIASGQPGDVGIGPRFAFPFVTIESVVKLDATRIGVLNDNNFPFSVGRHVGGGQPDDNEFIVIEVDPSALR